MRETGRDWEGEVEIYGEKEVEWEIEEKWREPIVGIYIRMDNTDLLRNSFLLKFL